MRALRRRGAEPAFATLLGTAAPALADRVHAARRRSAALHGWGGVARLRPALWGPGWALVGDAGYFKDPITAHGMTDALRDAELLADELVEALAGRCRRRSRWPRYQATRDRLSRRLFAATEAVAGYDWDRAPSPARCCAQVSSAMSDEVEHLQALPDRRVGPGVAALSALTRATRWLA